MVSTVTNIVNYHLYSITSYNGLERRKKEKRPEKKELIDYLSELKRYSKPVSSSESIIFCNYLLKNIGHMFGSCLFGLIFIAFLLLILSLFCGNLLYMFISSFILIAITFLLNSINNILSYIFLKKKTLYRVNPEDVVTHIRPFLMVWMIWLRVHQHE